MKTRLSTLTFAMLAAIVVVAINALPERAEAEYGDVVINEY